MQTDVDRLNRYRKEPSIEAALHRFNESLMMLADHGGNEAPKGPIVFVVGTQRSGTTLLMQLLTSAFRFTYPDNIVARFWTQPHLGVAVSRSLRSQLGEAASSFNSDHGVTSEVFGPHEFGNFWTRWFGFDPIHQLTHSELLDIDVISLRHQLALMESFGTHPLLFKTVPLSMNVSYLADVFPQSRFLYITRDPLYVAQSTMLTRVARYGTRKAWWSLKPADFELLQQLEPIEQVVAQIYCCRRRIESELETVAEQRVCQVGYEQLCRDPARALLRFLRSDFEQFREFPTTLDVRNTRELSSAEFARMSDVVSRYFEPDGKLKAGHLVPNLTRVEDDT